MALKDIELAVHRKGTEQFIAADPTLIILTPRVEQVINGTKSFSNAANRSAQLFKVIWAGDNGIIRNVGSEGGVRRFDFILVGKHDATVAIGDYWKTGNQEHRIEYRFPDNGYEVKVGGVSHGSKPTGN